MKTFSINPKTNSNPRHTIYDKITFARFKLSTLFRAVYMTIESKQN